MNSKKIKTQREMIATASKFDYIILYGAGLVGGLVAKRLKASHLSEKVVGFAISKKNIETNFRDKVCGLNVYVIGELIAYTRNALVIVATMRPFHDEIQSILEEKGFENTCIVTNKLFEDCCKHYIIDFRKENSFSFTGNSGKNILFMASDNNRTSGAFLCMAELCEMLEEEGFSALVVLPKYGTGEEVLKQKKISYTYIPSRDWGYEISKNDNVFEKLKFIAGLLTNYKAKIELAHLIKAWEFNLVHCNTTYTYIGAIAAIKCKIPFVWHIREDMNVQGYRIFAKRWALRLIQKADKVIAVSEYIKNKMEIKDSNLISVIYDAVGESSNYDIRREILKQKTVQMVIVGAIAPFKGQKELIDACKLLKKKAIKNFYLKIVGAGDKYYIEELKKEIYEYHLENYIEFYGVSHDIYGVYKQSDFAFTCSAGESYGRVTIEALLSGCFVIGVDSGATSELIQDGVTGLLYKKGDVESLAECIEKAIKNPEQSRKIAQYGSVEARKKFTKENNIQQILEVYEGVL